MEVEGGKGFPWKAKGVWRRREGGGSGGGGGGAWTEDGEGFQRAVTDAVKLAPIIPLTETLPDTLGLKRRIHGRRARWRQMAPPSESVLLISVKWWEPP